MSHGKSLSRNKTVFPKLLRKNPKKLLLMLLKPALGSLALKYAKMSLNRFMNNKMTVQR